MSEEINWLDLHKDATTVLEGEFPVVVTEAVAGSAATSGNPMIKAKLRVESGTYAGRVLFHNFNVTPENPAAMRMFFGQMSVFGIDGTFFARNPRATVDQIAQALVSRKAIAVVGSREWQGALREDIKNWKPAPGGPGIGAGFAQTLGGMSASAATAVAATAPAAAAPLGAQPSSAPPADPFA